MTTAKMFTAAVIGRGPVSMKMEASRAANVLIWCTVQECVHIWLWLRARMQRCSENNLHVRNWKFKTESLEALTRAPYSGFGQCDWRWPACFYRNNYICFIRVAFRDTITFPNMWLKPDNSKLKTANRITETERETKKKKSKHNGQVVIKKGTA